MKKLIIVGAGGFGREVAAWAKQHPDCGRLWSVHGFLDDNPAALDGFGYAEKILAPIHDYVPNSDECFVCAIGAPAVKQRVCEALLKRSAEFISLVHPSVVIGAHVQMGRGVVLCPGAVLTSDIRIGDFVAVNCLSSVGHDVEIGDWSTISGHCDLTGNTRYGARAFLGSGARILPGKMVGADAFVGAGSVVIRSVPAGKKVFGNPARVFSV